MKREISFKVDKKEYYGTVWIFENANYDVTEFYTFDENGDSKDIDWKPFQYYIEKEISEYLPRNDGKFGGYDDFFEGLKNNY